MDAEKQTEGAVPESFRYLPMTHEDMALWLDNFRQKMEACYTTFGFTPEEWNELQKLSPNDPSTGQQ